MLEVSGGGERVRSAHNLLGGNMSLDSIELDAPQSSTKSSRRGLIITLAIFGAWLTATQIPWLPAQQEAREAAQSLLIADQSLFLFNDKFELDQDLERSAEVIAREESIERIWAPAVLADHLESAREAAYLLSEDAHLPILSDVRIELSRFGRVTVWGDKATLSIEGMVFSRVSQDQVSPMPTWLKSVSVFEIEMLRNADGEWQLLSVVSKSTDGNQG